MPKNKRDKYNPIFIALVSLCLFIAVIFSYTKHENDSKEKNIRVDLYNLLMKKKSNLEKSLNSRIHYAKGIAAYISVNPKITKPELNKLADKLVNGDTVLAALSTARGCVINYIYPEQHKNALGLSLKSHPKRKKVIENITKTGNTFVTENFDQPEGGTALIIYTPVFAKKAEFQNFWGVTNAVIWKEKLFKEIGLTLEDDKYKYAITSFDHEIQEKKLLFGNSEIFNNNPVTVDIQLPTGKWVLAGIPVLGFKHHFNKTNTITILLYISALIISFLIWLTIKTMLKIRTHELELENLFGSMDDLIIEFNRNYEYVKIAPTNDKLLLASREKVIGKKVSDFFEKKEADIYISAIKKCFETKKTVTIDYEINVANETLWFEGRISYIDEDSVLFIAHDNTAKKRSQEKLEKSESQLRQINKSKDKLFSIIAHDLRSPFNTTLGLTEILKEDISSLSNDEIKEMLSYIESALKGQLKLLENLLNWTQLQTNHIKFEKTSVNLKILTDEVLSVLDYNLRSKKIEIMNHLDRNVIVKADIVMLKSIIQNLVTNAIKFTQTGGKIDISAKEVKNAMEITVRDNGIGMSKEDSDQLFTTDLQYSTSGTLGEKGTGLGLILVREIIEKHKGSISVESKPGRGTKFTFTLPS